MSGLKEIYRSGTAAVTDPALKAERVVSAGTHVSTEQLAARQREVADRNKRQIKS
jgi:enoyl-CoA hydratase